MSYQQQVEKKLKNLPDVLTILAIESSCDETACAILRGRDILANVVLSSAKEQAKYGGVVPEIASRMHIDMIENAVQSAIKFSKIDIKELNGVACTYGAGLVGSLLVGLSFAKAFAFVHGLPFIAVNHIRGHMAAAYLADKNLKPPFITLLASGGHTAILHTKTFTDFDILGSTRDDAVGEAFDKVARVLNLPYPGGVEIENLAKTGQNTFKLPQIFKGNGFDFSFSGLKTAVVNYVHNAKQKGEEIYAADIACSFQTVACNTLAERAIEAVKVKNCTKLVAGGGVICNSYLRELLQEKCRKEKIELILPEKKYCTDNAAMIAMEGAIQLQNKNIAPLSTNATAYIPLAKKGKIIDIV